MKLLLRSFFLLLGGASPALATVHTYQVKPEDIRGGYIIQQVNTSANANIQLVNAQYTAVASLPKGVTPAEADKFTKRSGVERKQAFVILQIPAYSRHSSGSFGVLSSYSLDVPDAAPVAASPAAYAKTAASNSPLSSGTWFKIAVPQRGVYKIDQAFIKSLGVNTDNISSASIRLLGNGGAMLPESNATPQFLELKENALWINDGGDGVLNSNDFVAFYTPGPTRWDKDEAGHRFIHQNHLYADSSYYFLSFDAGAGKAIGNSTAPASATVSVSSFNDYVAHEVDKYNPGHFGKEWWGEKFGSTADALASRTFSFPLNSTVDSIGVRLIAASRSTVAGNRMTVALNNTTIANFLFGTVSLAEDDSPVARGIIDARLPLGSSTADFNLTYDAQAIDAIGYLNYIELNWRRPLTMSGGNLTFRDWNSVGSGAVAGYSISGATGATQVWDVTDPTEPVRVEGSLAGNTYTFNQYASNLHEFVALDGSSFLAPVKLGKIENQNLSTEDAPGMVIVTHPDFLAAANRLANYHRDHDALRVMVATTDQVYNEFSSGAQDIGGIRNMMRHYYLAAGTDTTRMPRYLLLFGDASYDYKDRITNNGNFVPTYESNESMNPLYGYTVDDFFGFLDDSEDIGDYGIINTLDIGVGRIPVTTETSAEAMVDKIISYSAPASLGPWRLTNTYVGDNEDGAGEHLEDAEIIAHTVDAMSPFSNDFKVYLDNLPFVSTPGGQRSPDANKAINDQIFKGTFLINYTGHGSTTTLAHERILTKEDFSKWKNINKLPFMITATCDYARYDDPSSVSNGEGLVLKADGGTIAMLTTTGPVYASINEDINKQFLEAQYTQINGIWQTFGDAMRHGKNETYKNPSSSFQLINFYRFTLLGDPAVQPAFPKHRIATDAITAMGSTQPIDTMRALGAYTVSGHIEGTNGNLLTDFNGRAYVTIYDKPRLINLVTKETNTFRSYNMQDNIIFKGLTTVTNGRFSCSFIAPKDMSYEFGQGKISYYAENGITDAAGMDTTMVIGGFSDGAITDDDAPIVKPFIGDTLFRDGGITGTNTLLYVQLSDNSGINVSGNSVGHDLVAVLDGDEQHPYVLNDYYQTESNTYKRGRVSFPISGLSDGLHSIRVKAWDVYNNSGEGTVRFVVGTGGFQIQNLMNYPNPFTDVTHFIFEHNHPGETLKVQIAIYNTAGVPVRMIDQSFTPSGSNSNEITWDGTDANGARLPSGVYPYRMILSTEQGVQGSTYQKLVIVR
jgi:hypothetical protein